jgi:hypothetical protein
MAIGAPTAQSGQLGRAYLYDVGGSGFIGRLDNPSPTANDYFGSDIAISGSRIVVCGGRDAYLYDVSTATPLTPVAALQIPTAVGGSYYSSSISVALQGTTVVLGNSFDNTVAPLKGYIYVYGPASNDTDNDGLLDLWEYARFGTTAGHSALDDADHDGRTELVEQAFNTNPLVPDGSALFPVTSENGYLTATITKRAGVNYLVQSGATLDAGAFSAASTTVLLDNVTTLKVRDNVPVSTPGSRFIRVKLTAAP